MSSAHHVSLIGVLLHCLFHAYDACPPAYAHCASENTTCAISNRATVIAYGADSFRWTYQPFNTSFMCDNTVFGGDPVIGITKECCYQWPLIAIQPSHPWTWVAGYTACNSRTYSYVASEAAVHIWTFITTATWNVTFSDCGSSMPDTQLYLFDASGTDITSGSCTGDGCGSECYNPSQQTFTYRSLPAGQYYLQFEALNGAGKYQFSLSCPGHHNHYYPDNVLNCAENTISAVTSADNNVQYFQINVGGTVKQDVTFESCGSDYDTTLYVYSDSLYQNQLIGGDNDACPTGKQERYRLYGLEPGKYYAKLGRCIGAYTFSVTCADVSPTQPSLNPTSSPTTPAPISAPPTPSPTYTPTSVPTLQPSSIPSSQPTQPTLVPTLLPTLVPTLLPTLVPTLLPTQRRIGSQGPTTPTEYRYPTTALTISATSPPTLYGTEDAIIPIRHWKQDPVDREAEDKANNILIIVIILGVVVCVGFCIVTFLRGQERGPKKRRKKKRDGQVIPAWKDPEGDVDELHMTRPLERARTYKRVKSNEEKQQIQLVNHHAARQMRIQVDGPTQHQERIPMQNKPARKPFVIKVEEWPVGGGGGAGADGGHGMDVNSISEMRLPNLP